MGENELIEEPFILKLIKSDNTGNFSTIYELKDESFDKERPRKKFDWRKRWKYSPIKLHNSLLLC